MSAISEYQKFQAELGYAKSWAALIGKPYRGGGGGIGELVKLAITAEAYHQDYDGATNYHSVPDTLARAIALQVRIQFAELLAVALVALEMRRVELAAAALREHEQLMRDAGLLQPQFPPAVATGQSVAAAAFSSPTTEKAA